MVGDKGGVLRQALLKHVHARRDMGFSGTLECLSLLPSPGHGSLQLLTPLCLLKVQALNPPTKPSQVAGGQGTVAIELLTQLSPGQLDTVLVPVGGGGLISGRVKVLIV